MKILYVEDNDDNIYMLRNRLTRAETERMLARVRALQPGLVEELIPTQLALSDVQKVLQKGDFKLNELLVELRDIVGECVRRAQASETPAQT